MRALAVLLLVASCHREPPAEDCFQLLKTPLRDLDRHSFSRACGPLLPAACRPPTTGVPDATTFPTLETACRAATHVSGDVLEEALPKSVAPDDRRVIAMALRSELTPPPLRLHVHASEVDIDGTHVSTEAAVAAVKAHGGGALLFETQDEPEETKALVHALDGESVVICTRNNSNCR